ncbi:D-arabinono-1,4-lactone oxidase [Solimonas marina]|uniref:FAD-binding protein n=1 Tax=Solimonas marina TaxID=2714601 RepID=A0A969WE01_9GAMM|nr:D-arabinono-1,4-lactone oxidase [Solimonas marina]NKF24258.1 FAD-binding protein [Solimonas marina]
MSTSQNAPVPVGSTTWRNWSGSVECRPERVLAPRTITELQQTVARVNAADGKLRVAGSGHSFVPLVETDATLLTLDAIAGVERIENNIASILGGTTLKPLGHELRDRGYGMMNLGDINKQAIAGAVSTGTHGTGITLGSISTQVAGMTLVTPDGSLRECSETKDPDLFAAARVSMGALGVIAKMDIKLQPGYRLKLTKQPMHLDDCLARAPELARSYRHFEFYWVPHTRGTLVKLMEPTQEPESNTKLTGLLELILENGALGLLSRMARARPQWTPKIAGIIASSIGGDSSTMVADCHRAFSSVRLVRFNEMEYELPAENGPAALREFAEFVDKKKIQVHFPVEYRYVKGDDIWLSPFYGRDSAAISVHQYQGMDYREYFSGAEAIFRNHGGRPHWGKMHTLTARDLEPLYPRWNDFLKLRAEIDPKGMFINPWLQKIFGL